MNMRPNTISQSFAIEDNKVVIENGGKTFPAVTP